MRNMLEKYLTAIPMYRLVVGALGFIILSAFALTLTKTLAYEPLSLIVTGAIFAGVSVGINLLFGWLYKVPAHTYSALITGLILTLLFAPTLEPVLLLQYGFIAIVAQASKYILAIHRRHIFNPAAIAALICGALLQLNFASWWFATPALFAPLLIASVVVLYKTRQVALGGIFVGVGLVAVVVSGLMRGEEIVSVVLTGISSWPLIFIAGFMLSEPLTLPPRRWQQYCVAVVMALLVALPFHVGTLYSSPELAIVVANIVAFFLALRYRRRIDMTFASRKVLTPTTDELTFTTTRPVVFTPGQYIELTLPHARPDKRGVRRMFSLTSIPGKASFSIGVKYADPSSSFKSALRLLEPDSMIEATGIVGDFVAPRNETIPILWVAGGIGITPFISQLRSGVQGGRDVVLLYFARTPKEIAYRKLLDASGIRVIYCVAEKADDMHTDAAFLTNELLEQYVPDSRGRQAYVSGPPAMVAAVSRLLRGKVKRVHTDYFSGY